MRRDVRLCLADGASLAVLAMAVGAASPSWAQTQTAQPSGQISEVIVTASRIETKGFVAPTPTTVIGVQDFQARAAVQISDVLQNIPSFFNGQSGIGTSSAGQNNINLRGLNGNNTRSLVLLDGDRPVSTDQYGHTDTSIIPTALVQRVDVVTGGASAAWGSDAIAGVVNLILKDHLDGVQGNVQYGQSTYGDEKNIQGSLAAGRSFAGGRGEIMAAGEYSNVYDPPTFGSRPWGNQNREFTQQTINGVTYANVPTSNVTSLLYAAGGVINGASTSLTKAPAAGPLAASSPLYGIQFSPSGIPQTFNYGTTPGVTSTAYGVNGSGLNPVDGEYISNTSLRYNGMIRGSYDLTDSIKVSASVLLAHTSLSANQNPVTYSGSTAIVVSQSNPYLQALTSPLPGSTLNLYQTMVKNGIQTIGLGELSTMFGQYQTNTTTNLYNVALGLDGKFGSGGKWSIHVQDGASFNLYTFYNNVIDPNLRAALDPISAGGVIQCNPAVVAQYGAQPGCVPINPFGGQISATQQAYLTGSRLTNHTANGLTSINAFAQDALFNDWAGPVILAAGVEARQYWLSSITSPYSNLPPQTYNYGVTSGGGYDSANPKTITRRTETAEEIFGELNVPILQDQFFTKSLNVDLAAREAHYSVSGDTTSWKVGAVYTPFTGLLLRATDSQDSRAPNLTELYSGANINTGSISSISPDPVLPGQSYSYNIIQPGNPKVLPEVGHTKTFGFTVSPTWISGLKASVDVWDIVIDNEIGQPGAANIVNGCYGIGTFASAGAVPAFCAFVVRAGGPGAPITTVYNTYVNAAIQHERGIDYEISYHTPLNALLHDAPGVFDFRALATDLQSLSTQTFAGFAATEASGLVADPHWKWTLDTTYSYAGFDINVENRYVDGTVIQLNNNPNSSGIVPYYKNNIPPYWYTSLHVDYNFSVKNSKKLQVYFNINNLFNVAPPFDPAGPGISGPTVLTGNYDVIGRAFVGGFRFQY